MNRMPKTKPNWTTGKITLWQDDEIIGYFRRFESAWTWKNYLQVSSPKATFRIYDNGALVNIASGDALGNLLPL